MSELNPELIPEVVESCQNKGEEIASALRRALERDFTASVGEPTTYKAARPEGFDGAGFVAVFKYDNVGMAAILPESSGLLPSWYSRPDHEQKNKLNLMVQELSKLTAPEKLAADECKSGRVEQIAKELDATDMSLDAALVPLQVASGDAKATLSLIWPLASPDLLLPKQVGQSGADARPLSRPKSFSDLPGYSRSLLKIQVPVRVVLASKKEKVGEVVELTPGSIIQFDKPCEELLNLFVGDQEVAEGEAVKVGDKFGFRISAMRMPYEHFMKVLPKHAG